jgi:hypothetical protein
MIRKQWHSAGNRNTVSSNDTNGNDNNTKYSKQRCLFAHSRKERQLSCPGEVSFGWGDLGQRSADPIVVDVTFLSENKLQSGRISITVSAGN